MNYRLAGISKRALVLLPSWLAPSGKVVPLARDVSYPDGIRGIAALLVHIYHTTGQNFGHFMFYYGTPKVNGVPVPSSIIQLPFFRLIFSGAGMVPVFFVISGFVLTIKILRQIRANDRAGAMDTLGSLIFRRFLRLYMPIYATASVGLLLSCFHLLGGPRISVKELLYQYAHSSLYYSDFCSLLQMSPPLAGALSHLWTIPLETRYSMVLFLVAAGLLTIAPAPRLTLCLIMSVLCLLTGYWVASTFLVGMFLAEIELIQASNRIEFASEDNAADRQFIVPSDPVLSLHQTSWQFGLSFEWMARNLRLRTKWRRCISENQEAQLTRCLLYLNLICSLWLFGWPDRYPEQTPSVVYLYFLSPQIYISQGNKSTRFFWHSIASFQLIAACQQIPILRRALSKPIFRYLGHISFALYLLHPLVLKLVGQRISAVVKLCLMGTSTAQGNLLCYSITLFSITFVAIWVADVFTNTVDAKCVEIARRCEARLKGISRS